MHFLFCSLNSDSALYLLPVNDAAFLSQTVKQICPTNHNSPNFTSGCVQLLNTKEQFNVSWRRGGWSLSEGKYLPIAEGCVRDLENGFLVAQFFFLFLLKLTAPTYQ